MTPEQRFASFVSPEPNSGCWLWVGAEVGIGYGVFWDGQREIRAHRWAYKHFIGPIPAGLFVCHSCDVRCCVNPKHLWIGTNRDNLRDAARKNRIYRGGANLPQNKAKTHCIRGHPLSGINLCFSDGRRNCLTCMRIRWGKIKDVRNAARRTAVREAGKKGL